jgi:two-component system sensor histidine kinase DegS
MSENKWSEFLESARRGREKVQQELKEVDMLIQQTSAEVDRLVQRNARAAAQLRQIEAQFDTMPREDIRSTYGELVESQQRLFTMRGQLEKLQSDQKNMTRLEDLYDTILDNTTGGNGDGSGELGEQGTIPQSLVVNIIEAQERERLRLSRQMHDGPAQSLTNLVLQAEICERLFDRDPDRAKGELAELKEDIMKSFHKVKGFIFDLRPMMLDDLGLMPTLRRYAEGLEESGFKGITLNLAGKERRLASYREVTIFRVIQELIHISREYSRASNIKVTMNMEEEQVRVSVEDNGSGFDLDEALTTADAKRMGLSTLRERIEMLGGEMHFDSTNGQGFQAVFSLPAATEE